VGGVAHRERHTWALHRGRHRKKMGFAGGVCGSLDAHEREGKSVRTHADTLEQAHARARHNGGTERPEPRACTWFVRMDEPGTHVWSLVVVVLRALGRGGGG
jgi:hypothetical protein